MRNTPCRPNRDSGIALVAVLAFLAILVVLAVSFMTSMRTERLAAEAQKDDAVTEQFLKGCMASAMDRINDRLITYTNNYTLAAGGEKQPVNIHFPKSMAVMESYTGPAGSTVSSSLKILSGEVMDWLPRRFFTNTTVLLDPDLNASNIAAQAQWIEVRDQPAPKTNVLGRYAFVALECTGSIDANLAGGGSRNVGLGLDEISLDPLAEVGSGGGNKLIQNKAKYTRFATVPEILYLNDGDPQNNPFTEATVFSTSPVKLTDLVPYSSCYLENKWFDWTNNAWKSLGDLGDGNTIQANVQQWTEVDAQNVFTKLGYTAAEAADMAKCYADYVDTDFSPGGSTHPNTQVPCGECIPQMNEFQSSQRFAAGDDGLGSVKVTNTVFLDVECWNPCVGAGATGATNVNSQPYYIQLNSVAWSFQLTLPSVASITPVIDPQPKQLPLGGTQGFQVVRFTNVAVATVAATGAVTTVRIVNQSFGDIDAEIVQGVAPASSGPPTGEIVDRTQAQGQDLQLNPVTVSVPPAQGISNGPKINSLQANDPRMNHTAADWSKANSSLGAMNSAVVNFNRSQTRLSDGSLSVEGQNVYVRNSTNIATVAELGYIQTGHPWTTLDLFTMAGRHLLAKFTTSNLTARIYTNGLINPNTLSTNVYIAALAGAPLQNYPDETGAAGLSVADAGKIAISAVGIVTNGATIGAKSLDSPGAWVTAEVFTNVAFNSLNNNQKESVIRNSYRLFNPYQNLFTVVVVAQTMNSERIVTGEKRAVALVWRDPFPDTSGNYEMYIRQFRYLDQ